MKKIAYTPELLAQLAVIKKTATQLSRLEEDKPNEQLIAEIDVVKDILDMTKQLVQNHFVK
ncbi:hypothetical protein [Ohtaekwangia koreensis]|uniref:Uncharacterized protein n=1 Tax=Ohtaekwangia koreensis TaxID=688867 RepID=A0A1T5J7Y7_9BACT|nr:hypothetical protein [Ohtaekwangia koreensis]SKC47489.1 hypothetical protein SAMN05660236_0855 [Ohtaekwangia koreensis]